MKCGKCGATDVPEGAAFCTYCGASTAPAYTAPASAAGTPAPGEANPSGNPINNLIAKAQGAGARVDDRLVWLLAVMPLLGEIVEHFVAGMIYGDTLTAVVAARGGHFWWVTLAINIALCWKDEKNLRQSGVDTSTFGKMIWLIPVYLYQRAKALNHSLAYFITWCVCFALLVL